MDYVLRALPPGFSPAAAHLSPNPAHLRNCLHTYVYIRTPDAAFWMYPTAHSPDFLHGYAWDAPLWRYVSLGWGFIEGFS